MGVATTDAMPSILSKPIPSIEGILPKIKSVNVKQITLQKPFLDYAQAASTQPNTVVLMSGKDSSGSSRYHMIGMIPWLIIQSKNNDVSVTARDRTFNFHSNPFDIIKQILATFKNIKEFIETNLNTNLPLMSGLMGYLSYDLKQHLDDVPSTCHDDLLLPDLYLCAPSIILIHDMHTNSSYIATTHLAEPYKEINIDSLITSVCNEIDNTQLSDVPDLLSIISSNIGSNGFIKAVSVAKAHIAKGDIFQINLSHRFKARMLATPFSIFRHWYNDNPASFFSYINANSHCIVSTSPERFLCRFGDTLETRPIKGTRPRGQTSTHDKELQCALSTSNKDDAELTMIVDLVRNDLAKVCMPGSIKITSHKAIESYKNVHHLVSTVQGTLEQSNDSIDAIQALFPGGSITGCPKLRAMELIDELETHQRHIYTGSIGYISFHDTFDLSIAIRTGICIGDTMYFSVGSGIVFDSNPEQEYQETLDKAHAILSSTRLKQSM